MTWYLNYKTTTIAKSANARVGPGNQSRSYLLDDKNEGVSEARSGLYSTMSPMLLRALSLRYH